MPSPEPITSPRFSYWVVFFVISVVSLYAIIEAVSKRYLWIYFLMSILRILLDLFVASEMPY